MDLSKLHPNELVERSIILNEIRKLKPTDVGFFNNNLVIIYENENNEEVTEIDWEYCLFTASTLELKHVFSHYNRVKKEPKINKANDSN